MKGSDAPVPRHTKEEAGGGAGGGKGGRGFETLS